MSQIIANRLILKNDQQLDGQRAKLIKAKTGQWSLEASSPEHRDYLALHSRYNPLKEAQKQVSALLNPQIEAYLVWGLGALHHIELLCSEKQKHQKIIVLEPNVAVCQVALEQLDLDSFLEFHGVTLLHHARLELLAQSLCAVLGQFSVEHYAWLVLANMPRLYPKAQEALEHCLQQFYSQRQRFAEQFQKGSQEMQGASTRRDRSLGYEHFYDLILKRQEQPNLAESVLLCSQHLLEYEVYNEPSSE